MIINNEYWLSNLIKNNKNNIYNILLLNFKRFRFFPSLLINTGETYTNASLGIFSKAFMKNKAFLKNKINFILLAKLLRKILIHTNYQNFVLLIKKVPKYFTEILYNIYNTSVTFYKHPFLNSIVDEKRQETVLLKTSYIYFLNNKAHTVLKKRKKGRLKRKITRKLIKLNLISD